MLIPAPGAPNQQMEESACQQTKIVSLLLRLPLSALRLGMMPTAKKRAVSGAGMLINAERLKRSALAKDVGIHARTWKAMPVIVQGVSGASRKEFVLRLVEGELASG